MVAPALIGGVFLGILSGLPILNLFNCACCALVLGGGFLAAYLYLKNYPPDLPQADYGDGAVLGLLTGVFGALVWTIVELPLAFLRLQFIPAGDFADLEKMLQNQDVPPAVRDFLASLIYQEGLSFGMVLFSIVSNLIISVLFATLGAIIGVAVFRKRPRYGPPQVYGPPPNLPAPPPAAGA